MSLTKNTLASASYITTNGSTNVNFSFAGPATVNGVQPLEFSTALTSATTISTSPVGLNVPVQVTNPGVFTAGTAAEGTASKPTNDSNN